MNKLLALGGAALLTAGTAMPASAQSAPHILRGAGIGAAGGVVAGALIPGLSIGEGLLVGGAGGALYNTLIDKGHHRTYRSRSYSSSRNHGSAQTSAAPRYRSYRHN